MAILDSGTIVAVATPEGTGGLAIVRLSGAQAVPVARRLLSDGALDDPVASHRARLGVVRWPGHEIAEDHDRSDVGVITPGPGTAIDQVLVLPMLEPASYTGEDTIEFICHGGLMPARLVMAACRVAGARAALPGEFTRRAFLNGRLSLSQAEAVADLIAAEHPAGAQAALAQLRGGFNREVGGIEALLRPLLASLEGSLEFGDDDQVGPGRETITATLAEARRLVSDLLALGDSGRRLRDGVQVVLAGPPNAGKSSLFNALLGQSRALVDPEPGTTRDVVSAPLLHDGVLFMLHDTAGLRAVEGGVEAMGIERARQQLASADIVLDLREIGAADGRGEVSIDDMQTGGRAIVLPVWTKCDQGSAVSTPATSAMTGEGVAELRQRLVDEVRGAGLDAAIARGVVLTQRHEDRLRSCHEVLTTLLSKESVGEEVVASLLAVALQDLGSISGRVFNEQLLDDVFGRFCVGK